MRILIVEDSEGIATNLFDFLEAKDNEVDWVQDGYAALGICEAEEFDVIVLDLLLPRLSGLEVCRILRRERQVDVPILMLTALDSVTDKVTGFGAGADDYLVKPFSLEELWARLQALVNRRIGAVTQRALCAGPIRYDPQSQTVQVLQQEVILQPKCLQILIAMLRSPQKTFSRSEIERIVWGNDEMRSEAVRAHMSTLRRALTMDGRPPAIQTLHGLGYRLSPDLMAGPEG
ncbi:response regulator transcription factor [Roseovarius autotrophicus]|uniref:response regulator transcription factor n=1 Tax=Roseovarius autotrophicus TaxID=2824121 RepID=UPI0019E968F5|nr:response regulator transcription factor [Roseovarius autotrophicus]MBE0453616.1 response regulator transcription factor [Roseovarius sp.]